MRYGLNYSGTRFCPLKIKITKFPDEFYLKPFPDRRMIKLLTFDDLCPPLRQ